MSPEEEKNRQQTDKSCKVSVRNEVPELSSEEADSYEMILDEYGRNRYRKKDKGQLEDESGSDDLAKERACTTHNDLPTANQHIKRTITVPILDSDNWNQVVDKFELCPMPYEEWPAEVKIMRMVCNRKNQIGLRAFLA